MRTTWLQLCIYENYLTAPAMFDLPLLLFLHHGCRCPSGTLSSPGFDSQHDDVVDDDDNDDDDGGGGDDDDEVMTMTLTTMTLYQCRLSQSRLSDHHQAELKSFLHSFPVNLTTIVSIMLIITF